MKQTIKVNINNNRFKAYSKQAQKVYQTALDDVLDDLARTSSESAPHDEGILEKSWSKSKEFSGNKPFGVISYTVKKAGGKGNFNYALKMHEETYNLGEGSQNKPGGTGMSGKTYPVGTGYLGDVAKGEQGTYTKHIGSAIKNFSKRF